MGELRRPARLALLALAATGSLVLVPAPAQAAVPFEHVSSYDVTMTVHTDGTMHVREQIAYDFGPNSRHGIFRTIPTSQRYNNTYNRIYRVSHVQVRSPDGAPTQLKTGGHETEIRIGDPGRTITGQRTYVIDYDVAGAMTGFPDHQELYWNAIGAHWDVPIGESSAVVEMPVDVNRVRCFADSPGGKLPCREGTSEGNTATFHQTSLAPHEAFTVVVGIPAGSVPAKPILERRWSPARAFALTPVSGAGLGAILLLMAAGVWRLVSRRGRDRRYVGQVPGLSPVPGQPDGQEHRPLFTRPDGAVEFVPPEGVRPGQAGTLIDERADAIDVTATIVDLAVRRYIHIEERPPTSMIGPDWRFSVSGQPDDTLLPYERMLLDAMFRWSSVVNLSHLRHSFKPSMQAVRSALYDDVVRQGWFARRPDTARRLWTWLGVALALAGVIATLVLAIFTHLALLGVGVLIGGLFLAVCGRFMPARTARGSAVLARVLGFRQYLRTADLDQLQFEERELILSRVLPYAIAFGDTEHLARAFASLSTGRSTETGLYWYSGPGARNLAGFGTTMAMFGAYSSTALASSPASSSSGSSGSGSSGFSSSGSSGSGGGGGGGGSW
jgi:uncharacterized membrane protein YgcG